MSPIANSELTVLDLVPFGPENSIQTFALRLSPPPWQDYKPGQFVMLRPQNWGLDLLWARPFSISQASERDLVCFFQVVGRGTARLAQLKAGDVVRVWGPLGNGFAVQPDRPTLLLAGGVGLAPFIGYVQKHPKPWKLSMLFGHRAPLGYYPVDSLNERIELESVQEGNAQELASFISLLEKRMYDHARQDGLALACGPLPFLRTVQRLAASSGLPTQLSLERRMACGVGACLGCVVPASQPGSAGKQPLQSCTHGPVFWSTQIELEEQA